MNLTAFFDELFATLEGAGIDLNVADDGPGVRARPPAPYVELPEIVYNSAGVGLDRIPDLGLVVVFGPANNAKVFKTALAYASTTGDLSVKQALESHAWESCDTLFVRSAEPTVETLQGANPALGYTFHIDVTGASS